MRLGMLLVIDGVEDVWHLGEVAPPTPAGRIMRPGLLDVGPVAARVDLTTSLPAADSVSVRIALSDETQAAQLLRLAPTGAPSVTLAQSLPPEQALVPLVVSVDGDTGVLPAAPGFLWVGRECIAYSAVGASTITIPTGGRGIFGSLIEPHTASPPMGWAPRLYTACVTWRHRRCRVVVGELTPAGDWIGVPASEVEGWIAGVPVVRDSVVELQLETLPAALDVDVGAAATAVTGLQRGWHLFDASEGARYLDCIEQVWQEGAAYDDRLGAAAAPGSDTLTAPTGAIGLFHHPSGRGVPPNGALIPTDDARPAYWLRAAPTPGAGGADDDSGTIPIEPNVDAALGPGRRLRNARADFRVRFAVAAPFTAEVVEWPPLAAIAAGLQTQPDCGWLSHSLDASGTLTLTPVWATRTPGALRVRMRRPTQRTCWGLMFGASMPRVEGGRVLAETWPAYRPEGNQGVSADRNGAPAGDAPIAAEYTVETGEPLEVQATLALAWWQPGERYMLVADDILPGGSGTIVVDHQREGESVRSALRVIGSQAADVITGGAPGFALELDPGSRAEGAGIADLPGESPPTVRAAAFWRLASPGVILAQLAASVAGTGSNGPEDVQPYGCAIPQDLILADEMRAFPSLAGRTLLLDEGESARELVSAVARSIGALVVERLDELTGRRRLSLVSAGLPSPFRVVASISDGDWLVDGRPTLGVDQRVISRVVFEVAARPEGGMFRAGRSIIEAEGETATVVVTDRDAVGEQGGADEETIELRGVPVRMLDPVQQRDALVPLAAQRFAAFGFPRRTLRGSVSWSRGRAIDAGSVVRLSARELIGYDGLPVASVVARVTAVERDVMAQRVSVEATYYDARTTGWAPSLQVSFVAGAVVTTVTQLYSPAGTPDIAWWRVGDPVLCIPLGDRGAAEVRTIVAIVADDVGLDAPPPAGIVGGELAPVDYSAAPARLREHAYQAPLPDGAQVYT